MTPFLAKEQRAAHGLRNWAHSALLIGGLGTLMALCAWLLWGAVGVLAALTTIALFWLIGPIISPQAVMRMYKARPIDPKHGQQFRRILEILTDRADLPAIPKLMVIPSSTLNAFAAGTAENASIAVTEGLLRRLSLREIAGVLAHEISHIRNNDLWIMGLADTMSRITQLMSYFGIILALTNLPLVLVGMRTVPWGAVLLLYFAPTLSSLLQMGLSRAREYDADMEGSQLTGDPIGLASALRKLDNLQGQFWEDMIFPGRRIPQPSLLRTHPPTEERIRRLKELHTPLPEMIIPEEEPMITLVGYGPATLHPRYHWPWPGIWY